MIDEAQVTLVQRLGRILWDYLRLAHSLEQHEAIVVFGGHDLRVADWAVQRLTALRSSVLSKNARRLKKLGAIR